MQLPTGVPAHAPLGLNCHNVGVQTQSPKRESALGRIRGQLGGQAADSAITSLSFLATAGLGFINAPILADALGAEGRGELAAVVAVTQLLGFMTRFGFPRAAAYFATVMPWRSLIMSAWAATALVALPVLIMLFPLYDWMLADKAEITVRWFYYYLALTVITNPANSAVFWLRGTGQTLRFNLYQALPAVLTSLGYLGLFAVGELNLRNALISTFSANAIAWGLTLINTKGLPGRGFNRDDFVRNANYGLRAWFGSLSYLVTFRIDQVVLTGLVSSAELGRYAVAATGATLSLPVSRGIGQTLLPHIRKASDDLTRIAAADRALRWVAAASVAILVPVALIANSVVPWIFGEDFAGAVLPLLLLLPGQWANDVATVYASALDSFNRPEDASKAQVVSAFVTMIGLAVAVPTWGIAGAAVVTSVAYFAYLVSVRRPYARIKAQIVN